MAAIYLLKARRVFHYPPNIRQSLDNRWCRCGWHTSWGQEILCVWGVNSSWLCSLSFWLSFSKLRCQGTGTSAQREPPGEERAVTAQPQQQPGTPATAQAPQARPPLGRNLIRFTHPPSLHIPSVSAPWPTKQPRVEGDLYLLLRISAMMRDFRSRFSAVTCSAFPPKIMKPLSTPELPPSHGLPGPARGELNPASSTP